MKNKKVFFRSHPRLIISISAVLLIVFIGIMYAFWSNRTWSEYRTSYQEWYQEVQTATGEALALPSGSDPERSKKLARLKEVSDSIDSQKDLLCNVNSLVEWQKLVAIYEQRQDECRKTVGTLTAFNQQLQSVLAYLESDHTLAKTLAVTADTSDKLAEKQWLDEVAVWNAAKKSIQDSVVTSEFNSVKELAIKKAGAVEVAWQEVVAANKAKSEAKYIDAEKDLKQAYASLKDVSESSASRFDEISLRLRAAYGQAFSAN